MLNVERDTVWGVFQFKGNISRFLGVMGSEDKEWIQLAQRRYDNCLLNSHKTLDHIKHPLHGMVNFQLHKGFSRIGLANMLSGVTRTISIIRTIKLQLNKRDITGLQNVM